MRIPLEREIGEGIAKGQPLTKIKPEYGERFIQLYAQIEDIHASVEDEG
jgi:hypothetical protein